MPDKAHRPYTTGTIVTLPADHPAHSNEWRNGAMEEEEHVLLQDLFGEGQAIPMSFVQYDRRHKRSLK